MIGAMIVIYLYVLIGCWMIFMAWRHSVAISAFSVKHWICGQSHSAVWVKGFAASAAIIGGLMVVGYMEAL